MSKVAKIASKRWGGSKPGERRGGRKKGVPNKANRDIRALAQLHGPACIAGLAKLMNSKYPAIRIAAMRELLDRGYGRAPQHIQGDLGTTINILIAGWAKGQLNAPGDDAKLINGSGSNGSGHPASE